MIRSLVAMMGFGAAVLGFLGMVVVHLSGGAVRDALPSVGAFTVGCVVVIAWAATRGRRR